MYNTTRKQTAFRLQAELIDRLKKNAKLENRSLNNYVESILMQSAYNVPNQTTVAAINEARSEKELETLDLDNFENYVALL